MLVDLKEAWKAVVRGNFVRRRFQMAVVGLGQRWLARTRREGGAGPALHARLVSYPTDPDWGSQAVGCCGKQHAGV